MSSRPRPRPCGRGRRRWPGTRPGSVRVVQANNRFMASGTASGLTADVAARGIAKTV